MSMSNLDVPKIFQHALKNIDFEPFKGARELFVYPNIPTSLVNRVKGEFSVAANEEVLLFRDMGFVANYPAGTVVTDRAIYIQNYSKQHPNLRFTWDEFKGVELDLANNIFVLVHQNDARLNIHLEYFCPLPQYYKVFGCAIVPCICRVLMIANQLAPGQWDTETFIANFPPLDNLCVTDIDAWIKQQIELQEKYAAAQKQAQQAQAAQKQAQQEAADKAQAQSQATSKPTPTPKPTPQPHATNNNSSGGSKWGKLALGILAGVAAVAGVVAATKKSQSASTPRTPKYPPGSMLPNSQIVGKDGLVPCPQCNGFPTNSTCPLCRGYKRVRPEVSIQFINQLMASTGLNPAVGAATMMRDLSMGMPMGMPTGGSVLLGGGSGHSSLLNSRKCTACAGTGRCGYCGGRGWKTILNSMKDCDMCYGGGRCQICMGRGTLL